MRELNIKEIRVIQLNILKQVTDFCDRREIEYFLCAGTMLGAIRHKGYIPWDDDIDIMIPRPDYERLLSIFDIEGLSFYDISKYDKYDKTFGKVADDTTLLIENVSTKFNIGVNIDVFPIDGFPEDENIREKHLNKLLLYRKAILLKIVKFRRGRGIIKNLFLFFAKCVLSLLSFKYLVNKTVSLAKKYDYLNSTYAGLAVWGYGKREIFPKHIYKSNMNVDFEGYTFNVPKAYNEYLSGLYGDYMKLPPKDKQFTHHDFKAYLLQP